MNPETLYFTTDTDMGQLSGAVCVDPDTLQVFDVTEDGNAPRVNEDGTPVMVESMVYPPQVPCETPTNNEPPTTTVTTEVVGELPGTGGETLITVEIAAAGLLVGSVLFAVGRRRRTQDVQSRRPETI